MKFTANQVGVDRSNAIVAAFAEETSPGVYKELIMFQRSLPEHDEQDGVCTVRGQQQYVAYGGVESWDLSRSRFSCSFHKEASDALGGVSSLDITFEIGDKAFKELDESIQYIFSDNNK